MIIVVVDIIDVIINRHLMPSPISCVFPIVYIFDLVQDTM